MKQLGITAAAVFVALTVHGYLSAPWAVAGYSMGTRANCFGHELTAGRFWNVSSCL